MFIPIIDGSENVYSTSKSMLNLQAAKPTNIIIKITVFWGMVPNNLVAGQHCFIETISSAGTPAGSSETLS
jgi:hypothetical protein